ncbi:hypothetical protein VP01_2045g1 [Puccinia sorghi]|uniref:DUF7727 domain-containing protein n=1 Tax=Puccinia sorghi TaxID=27349 RepID=A0A0L6VCQ1_9BASI|nr:hypothetical protein VP01_2045g1 [Puccinia sorghi]
MGKFIWSQWGRLVALTAGAWQLWGALWAIFYRKYFWDFVGGKLGPAGIIPPGFAAPFINLIVTTPVIQGACAVSLLYQTADATVIYAVAILAYVVAIGNGEVVGEQQVENSKV